MSWERNVVLKSAAELELMKEAGHINALALEEVRKNIRPGVTTAKLDKVAEQVIRDHGATPAFLKYPGPYPYPATINASINEELVHGLPSEKRVLREGDIFSVDCGTVWKGFVGDSAFTIGIGEISAEAQMLIDVTCEALRIGIDQMRPGRHAGDVSAAIQHSPGRGLLLQPGITIALEPMVLVGTHRTKVLADQWTVVSADGSLTAHFEHSVAVTEDEPLILTQ
uniref:Map, methionine aminopeptidase, methionyl aminopeptidase n=1 Tax=uncultured Chloroflexi bacterium Rifle_16ft_4_minimus_5165 TaxID=1665076 RepID=A0A0H4TD38_9CHLR|nr:map, methionine aminopeptidase, methionyl aminopeptidase [uncultured Chloroflexi bacterium Rifle_16ft_4_minimus_5165]